MAVSEECARVLEVNASAVLRYEGDGTATVVGRHNRDGIDRFRWVRGCSPTRTSAVGRARDTGIAGARRRLGRGDGRVRRADVAQRLPLDGRGPDRRRGYPLGRGRDRQRGPAAAGQRGPARRVLRARVARRRERAGARGPARLARPHRPSRRRAAPEARAQPPRRRPAAARLGRADAARRADALELRSRGRGQLLGVAAEELDAGLEELRELARGLHPGALTDHGLRGRSRRSAPGCRCPWSST